MVGLAVRAAKDGDNESMLPITPPTLDETGDIYAGVSAYGSDAMLAALDSVFKAAEAFGQRARDGAPVAELEALFATVRVATRKVGDAARADLTHEQASTALGIEPGSRRAQLDHFRRR